MKQAGFGSRHIATILGCGKSTINNVYNEYLSKKGELTKALDTAVEDFGAQRLANALSSFKKGPKILILDLETAPTIAAVFGRWKQNIGQDNVLEEGGWILTAAYKWLGSDEVHSISYMDEILAGSDVNICADLLTLISEADAVVAHNGQGFDIKVIETRCLINGLPAIPSVKVIDTLVMAKKKLKFNSNRLDSIGEVLGFGGKVKHQGIKMWLDVMWGNQAALDDMLKYNERDVDLLEKVYLRLRQIGHSGSNFNAGLYFKDDEQHCPTCGSVDLRKTGRKVKTALSEFEEVRCGECGSIHRTRDTLTTKEDRSKLLSPVV